MFRLLFVLSVALTISCALGEDLQVSRFSSEPQGNGRRYTVEYTSSSDSFDYWGDDDRMYKPSMVTKTISGDIVEAVLITESPVSSFVFEIIQVHNFESISLHTDVEGDMTLPRLDLTFPQGQHIHYSPGESPIMNVTYSRGSGDFTEQGLSWYFAAVDTDQSDPQLFIFSSFDIGHNPVHIKSSTQNATHVEQSVQVDIGSYEGVGLISESYIYSEPGTYLSKSKAMYITKTGNDRPFPEGFIGIYNVWQIVGRNRIPCRHETCTITCNVAGRDIDIIQLTDERGNLRQPVDALYTPDLSYALFNVRQPKGQFENYTCIARNIGGSFAQKVLTVENPSSSH